MRCRYGECLRRQECRFCGLQCRCILQRVRMHHLTSSSLDRGRRPAVEPHDRYLEWWYCLLLLPGREWTRTVWYGQYQRINRHRIFGLYPLSRSVHKGCAPEYSCPKFHQRLHLSLVPQPELKFPCFDLPPSYSKRTRLQLFAVWVGLQFQPSCRNQHHRHRCYQWPAFGNRLRVALE